MIYNFHSADVRWVSRTIYLDFIRSYWFVQNLIWMLPTSSLIKDLHSDQIVELSDLVELFICNEKYTPGI